MKIIDEPLKEIVPAESMDVRVDASAGDWYAYLDACNKIDCGPPLPVDAMICAKRRCALAYLGKRAQQQGGVCSKSAPRILTAECVMALSADNASQRFKRYPWLAAMLGLLAEIEKIQEEISLKSKVLPFSRPI